MEEFSYRNIWICLAVTLPPGAIGLYVLRYDQDAKGTMVLGLLVFGCILCHFLNARELRERKKGERPR